MQSLSLQAKAWREKLLHVPDVVERINYRARQMHAMRVRRSVGIKKIVVSHKAQPLYAWSVYIHDNKGEFDGFHVEGRHPLKRLYGNVYTVSFDVPRGAPVELIVHWNGGHVMLACPGRPWKVHAQIGKYHPEEMERAERTD
ncbi:hypothetical protein D3C87_1254810 [compost metagenome]